MIRLPKHKQTTFIFKNDRIYDAIHNILVIELPIIEQKKVILMTLIAQHPHYLTIGGFQRLNVKTFVSVSTIELCRIRSFIIKVFF